jgi:hypothetical protein
MDGAVPAVVPPGMAAASVQTGSPQSTPRSSATASAADLRAARSAIPALLAAATIVRLMAITEIVHTTRGGRR